MSIKIFRSVILFVIGLTTIFSTCNKRDLLGCPNSTYFFNINAKVYPDKDTINIGDTVWAEINSPDVFTDQNDNQQIDFSNAGNMGTDMAFVKLINNSPVKVVGAISKFKLLIVSGTLLPNPHPAINDTIIINFKMQEINNKYLFKMAIIPKDTGTFSFNFGNFAGVYRNNAPCPKADFTTRITQTDQHYYLFPGGADIPPGSGPDYYFYVK